MSTNAAPAGFDIRYSGNHLCLRTPHSQLNVDRCKAVAGAKWKSEWKCWLMPRGVATARRLADVFGPSITLADPTGELSSAMEAMLQANAAKEADASGAELPDIPGLKNSPWRHQKAAYAFAQTMPGVLLNMGMGTGKSLTTIGIIMGRGSYHIILCPKAVVAVWPWEFEKHFAGEVIVSALPGDPSVKKRVKDAEHSIRRGIMASRPVVVVCNYESAWRDDFAKFALSMHWDNLVMDEIHKVKSATGKASKFCDKLGQKARFRLGLTGTPLPHSPLDAFGIFRALDRTVYGTSFTRFRARYAIMGGYGQYQVVGYQNRDEFQQLFDSITFTAGRDVLDLPAEQHIKLECGLGPKTKALYAELEDDMYAAVGTGEITAANALVKMLRLAQVTSGHIKFDGDDHPSDLCAHYPGEHNAKKELLADTMDDLPVKEPIVVFARFSRDLDYVRQVSEGQGRTYGELSGRINQLADFKRGAFDVIGVNIQSGGVGVDLTRACYVFYYSCGYSLGDFQQSLARVSRPGQTRPVRFYYLVARKTIDEKIYTAMEQKHDVVDFIINGGAKSGKKLLPFV